jgi:hypothetical protein
MRLKKIKIQKLKHRNSDKFKYKILFCSRHCDYRNCDYKTKKIGGNAGKPFKRFFATTTTTTTKKKIHSLGTSHVLRKLLVLWS